jgi:hypothetical protein
VAPNHASTSVRTEAKRWKGYVQAGLLSREIKEFGVPTPLTWPEGNIAGSALRKPPVDPARSKNHCMHGISMHENREIPCSPVRSITGRAAQARPRPQS